MTIAGGGEGGNAAEACGAGSACDFLVLAELKLWVKNFIHCHT